MLEINRLTPDIKGKAFDPDWFLLRQRFEQFESGHVVLLEALRHALPILIGAIAFVDCKAVVAEVRAAIQQAERGQ